MDWFKVALSHLRLQATTLRPSVVPPSMPTPIQANPTQLFYTRLGRTVYIHVRSGYLRAEVVDRDGSHDQLDVNVSGGEFLVVGEHAQQVAGWSEFDPSSSQSIGELREVMVTTADRPDRTQLRLAPVKSQRLEAQGAIVNPSPRSPTVLRFLLQLELLAGRRRLSPSLEPASQNRYSAVLEFEWAAGQLTLRDHYIYPHPKSTIRLYLLTNLGYYHLEHHPDHPSGPRTDLSLPVPPPGQDEISDRPTTGRSVAHLTRSVSGRKYRYLANDEGFVVAAIDHANQVSFVGVWQRHVFNLTIPRASPTQFHLNQRWLAIRREETGRVIDIITGRVVLTVKVPSRQRGHSLQVLLYDGDTSTLLVAAQNQVLGYRAAGGQVTTLYQQPPLRSPITWYQWLPWERSLVIAAERFVKVHLSFK